MTPEITYFPQGQHLVNDDRQANWTVSLLAGFVITVTLLLLVLALVTS